MDAYLQEQLRKAYPESADAMVISALNEGVALADDAISGLAFLRTVIGKDIRGFLRRAGVMYAIHEYAKRGDLPFSAEFEKQTRGNWHWMDMSAGTIHGHIVKTPSLQGFPKDAPTREDKRLSNSGDLFDAPKLVPFDKLLEGCSEIYAWLGYGVTPHGDITHASWGIPAFDNNVYLAHVDILESAQTQLDIIPKTAVPAPEVKLSFKQHIQEYLEKPEKDEGEQ